MPLTTFHKRALLFWIGCMGTRSLAVWLAYSKPQLLPILGGLAAAIALGYLIIYFGHLRTTGAEVFGDVIWWNDLRPVHALLYAAFAYLALHKHPLAWTLLAADVMLGAGAWLVHHQLTSSFD